MSASSELVIVYDGDCPFCSQYVELVKIRETVGSVRLVNARSGAAEVIALQHAGYDLNDGMIASYEGRIFHGADCVNLLASLSTRSGTFNQINGAIFSSATLSRLLYPMLRRGRALTLRVLGRSRIDMA
jgi:predicted DCC family thiol-disulfide oxidoreductase YuxK